MAPSGSWPLSVLTGLGWPLLCRCREALPFLVYEGLPWETLHSCCSLGPLTWKGGGKAECLLCVAHLSSDPRCHRVALGRVKSSRSLLKPLSTSLWARDRLWPASQVTHSPSVTPHTGPTCMWALLVEGLALLVCQGSISLAAWGFRPHPTHPSAASRYLHVSKAHYKGNRGYHLLVMTVLPSWPSSEGPSLTFPLHKLTQSLASCLLSQSSLGFSSLELLKMLVLLPGMPSLPVSLSVSSLSAGKHLH